MIEKTVTIKNLGDSDQAKSDLEYWLSRTPEERISAVEILRRLYYGNSEGFKELLELFNRHKAEYIIVGSYALAHYGAPRYTGDMDLYIRPVPDNAQRVLSALDDFGFGSLNLTAEDFCTPQKAVQLGKPPVRIDILTSISGVTWDDAFSSRVHGNYGDVQVFFPGREQYIVNKKTSGRKKDIADLEAIGIVD